MEYCSYLPVHVFIFKLTFGQMHFFSLDLLSFPHASPSWHGFVRQGFTESKYNSSFNLGTKVYGKCLSGNNSNVLS